MGETTVLGRDGSTRVDRALGIRERVAFVPRGPSGDRLFLSIHEPAGDSVGGVLICSSILADLLANYQREVHLARHLASSGLTCVRFHYAGTGNSDGDPAATTIDSLCDDARWVGEQLRDSLDGLPIGFVGTRWGAVVAGVAAQAEVGAPLVLWEPIVNAQRFFREAMRSQAMSAIMTRTNEQSSGPKLTELLEANGYADILGDVIHASLYESAIGRDLLPSDGSPRPALVVQFGGSELRRELADLEQRLAADAWSVDTLIVDTTESWWLRSERITRHAELNKRTNAWLLAHLERVPA